ncbi:MAG: hypothetical protein KIT68_07460 [Phycisphaeraceae bacterium]|nr:hypothetical protein [Phycisphaeraceae bacterium]
MSAKWIRSKQWERQHLTGWLTPVRWVLHAFSTIRMAVILLLLVVAYGIAASVPIGLLALIPTYAVYGASLVLALVLVAWLPTWQLARLVGPGGAGRFVAWFAGLTVLGAAAVWLWAVLAWPHLRYDEGTRTGLRLFAGFVERYEATTLRRLPGMEMSELEFYAWWPLSLVLTMFVVNLAVATVRRIEFIFPNLGVLSVHSGIILIGLGSAYYGALKQEGDVLLSAGPPDASGTRLTPGPWETGFFDNTRVVLRVRQRGDFWEQRPLRGLPRYNAYNVNAAGPAQGAAVEDQGPLAIDAPAGARPPGQGPLVDEDVRFRVVGYAPYAELRPAWRELTEAERSQARGLPGYAPTPLRRLEVVLNLPDQRTGADTARTVPIDLAPGLPADRLASLFERSVNIEYTLGMPETRWQELTQALPQGVQHGLVVALGSSPRARLFGVQQGDTFTVGEADDAWTLTVRSIRAEPSLPLVSRGYQGATSSEMIVRVVPPKSAGPGARPFERFVYHRFPELAQDLVDPAEAGGQPTRRPADPAITLSFLDATALQVYVDEPTPGGPARAIVRFPGRPPQVVSPLEPGKSLELLPRVSVRLARRLDDARQTLVPMLVDEARQERNALGTHRRAAVAVEVSLASGAWKDVVWVPFTQYRSDRQDGRAEGVPVALPDGRSVEVVFGRLWNPLPGLALRLVDFEMIPYPHSTQPRDFKSDLEIVRGSGTSEQVVDTAYTSLNDPLKVAAFVWSEGRSWPTNALGWFFSRLGPAQFKFSQAGWDARGWEESRAAVQAGTLQRPFARFTILGVGNNPGIYVIAMGAVLMAVGIPWAFYLKPWLIRRQKRRIQEQLATGTYGGGARSDRPARAPEPEPAGIGTEAP